MIFIDRSVPKGVASALKAVRDDVRWLEDLFPHNTKDMDWLAAAGINGWLVICRDKRIRTRPAEIQAIRDHRAGCFCVVQKQDPTRWEYLKLLAGTLDEMLRLYGSTQRPFIYEVRRDGGMRRFL